MRLLTVAITMLVKSEQQITGLAKFHVQVRHYQTNKDVTCTSGAGSSLSTLLYASLPYNW